jgi:hypothetical protein
MKGWEGGEGGGSSSRNLRPRKTLKISKNVNAKTLKLWLMRGKLKFVLIVANESCSRDEKFEMGVDV